MNVTDGERALLLTSREAAKALSISERTLWTLTKAGLVQVVRIGRAVRYSLADLEAFIASRRKTAGMPMGRLGLGDV